MSNEKILIVDDEKEMCLLVKSFLDNEQFQTYTAYDATSALELLESVEPDLILLDIMLPEEDGISILKKLRSKSDTKDLPVIMLTAKGTEYDKVVGLDTGADDYVAKPFGTMELISRIKALLRRADRRAYGIPQRRSLSLSCKAYHPRRWKGYNADAQGVRTSLSAL